MKLTTASIRQIIKEELEKVIQEVNIAGGFGYDTGGAGDFTPSAASLAKQANYDNERTVARQQRRFRMDQARAKQAEEDAIKARKKREREAMDAPLPGMLTQKADELIAANGEPELEQKDFLPLSHVKVYLSKYLVNNAKYLADKIGTTSGTITAYGNELRHMDIEKIAVLVPTLKKMLGSQFDKGIKDRTVLRKLGSLLTLGGFRE